MPGSTARAPVRPSGWWYLAGALIAVGSLVIGVGLLVGGVRESRDVGEERTTVVPGEPSLVTFEEADSFTLYYAGPTIITSTSEIRRLAEQVGAEIRPAAGGTAVRMELYEATSSTFERDINGNQLVPLNTFTIDEPGDYTLSSNVIPGVGEFDAVLFVVTSPYEPLARGAVAALVVMGIGTVLAVIVTVGVAVARGRSKRAAPPLGVVGASAAAPLAAGPPGAWPSAPLPPGATPPGWPIDRPGPIVPPPPPGYGDGAGPPSR